MQKACRFVARAAARFTGLSFIYPYDVKDGCRGFGVKAELSSGLVASTTLPEVFFIR